MKSTLWKFAVALLTLTAFFALPLAAQSPADSGYRELAVDGLRLLNDKSIGVLYRVYDANGRARRYMGSVQGNLGARVDSPQFSTNNSLNLDVYYGIQRNTLKGKLTLYRGLDYGLRYGMQQQAGRSTTFTYTASGAEDTKTINRWRSFTHTAGIGVTPFVGISWPVRPWLSIGAEGRLPIYLTSRQTISSNHIVTTSMATGEVLSEFHQERPMQHDFNLTFSGSTGSNILLWLSFPLR